MPLSALGCSLARWLAARPLGGSQRERGHAPGVDIADFGVAAHVTHQYHLIHISDIYAAKIGIIYGKIKRQRRNSGACMNTPNDMPTFHLSASVVA